MIRTVPIRTVVVDDDFRVASIHARLVERMASFEVIGTAHSGADAYELILSSTPDLVLLDLYLPDEFGLDLISRVRLAGTLAEFIVLSAANESATVQRAVQLGVSDYVLKPFAFDALEDRLASFAERFRPLSDTEVRDQREVDRLLNRADTSSEALPKGLSAPTAELVLSCLREASEGLSASEAAEATGISRVSARRYLEYFAATGRAAVNLRYGTAGRPERRYSASTERR